MPAHGSNVAGEIVYGTPQGTPEEIRKAGLSLGAVSSCAPPAMGAGVRGCSMWKECRFHLTQMGGFKGVSGPKNIGYFLESHEGKKKEAETDCFFFTQHLQPRMDAGARDRQQGLRGERIAVIAQEGETIKKRMIVNHNEGRPGDEPLYDPKGRPGAPADWRPWTFEVQVSKFPRPGADRSDLSYEQELDERQRQRELNDPALQTGPPRLSDDEPAETWTMPADLPAAVAAPVATAEPVKAKK